jgi:hypothetical protein
LIQPANMNIAASDIIDENHPAISHAEPVLVVSDIHATVEYWKQVLGYSNGWTYGNPANHGGVSWHGAGFIQFGLNPSLAAMSEGHSVWIRARNIEVLYRLHLNNNANIVAPLENMPWGFTQYTVKDLNGYMIHFSAPASNRGFKSSEIPSSISIHSRKPTHVELSHLVASVGWGSQESDPLLDQCVTGATAINSESGETAGCVLLFGDNAGFYYVKSLIVDPVWQGKRIATGLMKTIMTWLSLNARDGATVGLFTGDHLANFYKQFGFMQCCGMYQQIIRKKIGIE